MIEAYKFHSLQLSEGPNQVIKHKIEQNIIRTAIQIADNANLDSFIKYLRQIDSMINKQIQTNYNDIILECDINDEQN